MERGASRWDLLDCRVGWRDDAHLIRAFLPRTGKKEGYRSRGHPCISGGRFSGHIEPRPVAGRVRGPRARDRMITLLKMKTLAASLRRTDPPRVAVVGDTALIWAYLSQAVPDLGVKISVPLFVLELPAQEVAEIVREKYRSDPLDVRGLMDSLGDAAEYPNDWKSALVEDAGESTRASVEFCGLEDPPGNLELVTLASASGAIAHVRADLYRFLAKQLFAPNLRIHPGKTWSGLPGRVTVWEGDQVVGILADYSMEGCLARAA